MSKFGRTNRVIVYEVENKEVKNDDPNTKKIATYVYQPPQHTDEEKSWVVEKKARAFRNINSISVLNEVVDSMSTLSLEKNTETVVKEAVKKISSVVEEMKLEFKKDYWG